MIVIAMIIHRWHGRGIVHWRSDWRVVYRRSDWCRSRLHVLSYGIAECDDALVVLNDTGVGDIQGRPLRPVEGVVHEGLHLIPTEHGEVIDVVIDGNVFDRPETVGSSVHPAAVVRLHL